MTYETTCHQCKSPTTLPFTPRGKDFKANCKACYIKEKYGTQKSPQQKHQPPKMETPEPFVDPFKFKTKYLYEFDEE